MIFTGFSPNTTKKDVAIAFNAMLPWNWIKIYQGDYQKKLNKLISSKYNNKAVFLTDSGRNAIALALKSANIKQGDEVIVQGFTCVVVTNAILAVNATPVFVDIDTNYCTDASDVLKKITKKTKAIIVQHSFGFSADIKKIQDIAEKNNIILIEDCAHALGTIDKDNNILGSYGDMSIISFGVDKVISSVRGGALIVNNQELVSSVSSYYDVLGYRNIIDVLQHIFHIFIFTISKPLYNKFIGKLLLYISKKLYLTNKIVTQKEKTGQIEYQVNKLENIFSKLAYNQLLDIEHKNDRRKKLAAHYYKQLNNIEGIFMPNYNAHSIYLRFPIHVANPDKLRAYAKKRGVLLGNWYNTVVAPGDCDISRVYINGTCPEAEKAAKTIVNLPTNIHISKQDHKQIVRVINDYAKHV